MQAILDINRLNPLKDSGWILDSGKISPSIEGDEKLAGKTDAMQSIHFDISREADIADIQ